ncbi:hypothetical protein LTR95_003053 [Oleoguttula sp. CCFEE 5521]
MSRVAPEVIDIGSSDNDDTSLDSEGEELPAPVHGSPTPPPQEVTLSEAIASLSEHKVRAMLTKVCATQKSSGAFVTHTLLHPIQGSESVDAKYQARFQACKHCSGEYEVALNDNKSCRYHPGDKEINDESSTWDDHDERIHGDSDELIEAESGEWDEGLSGLAVKRVAPPRAAFAVGTSRR